MPTVTITFEKWPKVEGPLTTQGQLDECSEDLFTDHRLPSNVIRGWDEHDNEIRILQIHGTESSPMVTAELSKGVMVILFNGRAEALTPDEFVARGFSE